MSGFVRECIDAARRLRPDLGESWRPYLFQSVGNGVLVTGCDTTVFKSGPRKGQTRYLKTSGAFSLFMPDKAPSP